MAEGEGLGAGPASETRCGDLLAVFGRPSACDPPTRRGSGRWSVAHRGEGWRLLSAGTSDQWKGHPVRAGRVAGVRYWLVGELYGARSRETGLLERVVADHRDPSTLNGHFVLLAWDSIGRLFHAWTNRFGSVHAYHVAGENGVAALGTFSPAVAALGSSRKLDWDGLAGFFACGFFPDDRTHFEDVRILRPASHYVFDQAGHCIRSGRYWQWRHEPDAARSYDDTVEAFAEVLDTVLDEQTSTGRVALPISGGLDSRTTVASLTRPGASSSPEIWSYSYGYSRDSAETRIAEEVADARDLPFERFSIEPYLFDRLPSVLDSVEGFQDVTQCRQAAVVPVLARRADVVVAAHWGDVWLDDMGVADGVTSSSDQELLDIAAGKVLKDGREWLLTKLCVPHLPNGDASCRVRTFIRDALSAVEGVRDHDFRVKAFKTDFWSFRWTLTSLRMFQAAAFPRLPFYDTRLADFFATVPVPYLAGRKLQIDYLKRFAPDLAAIDWQPYGANLYRYKRHGTWNVPRRAVRRVLRAMRRDRPVERNWEVQLLTPKGRSALEHHLLTPGSRIHEFVSTSDIREELDAFLADSRSPARAYTISMLLSFATWLERHG